MSEQAWWKKELYGNVCGTDEAKVILSDIKMYERLEDLCERLEAAAEARGREEVLSHTGFLRQWLNERPSGSLVVDAQLRHWLEFGLKQAFPTKPDRQTLMGYKVEVDENLNGNEWHLKSSPTLVSSRQVYEIKTCVGTCPFCDKKMDGSDYLVAKWLNMHMPECGKKVERKLYPHQGQL